MQYLVEEAAATCLELYEGQLHAAADQKETGESDVRARHRQLMHQLQEQS